MANVDRPNGFKPVGTLDGSSYEASVIKCFVPSTDSTGFGVGAVVKTAGSADASGKHRTVTKASAGNYVLGVVVGIERAPTAPNVAPNLGINYRVASTATYVYVNTNPELICEIQEDSDGGALAATNAGQNADFIDGGLNTTTGVQAMEIDSSTAATTNTLGLRLHSIAPKADNVVGTNAVWLVSFNLHELRTQTTGV